VPISPQCRMNFCSIGVSGIIISVNSVTTEYTVLTILQQDGGSIRLGKANDDFALSPTPKLGREEEITGQRVGQFRL
jgi:hypothetical protein